MNVYIMIIKRKLTKYMYLQLKTVKHKLYFTMQGENETSNAEWFQDTILHFTTLM